jgi:CBS domain-containing protein
MQQIRSRPVTEPVARQLMSTHVIACRPESFIEEVAELLAEHQISGMPVVDAAGMLVGVVSERDLAYALGGPLVRLALRRPHHKGFTSKALDGSDPDAHRVNDVMTTSPITAHPETPLHTLARIMEREEINRIPIVNRNALVGIVTRGDVLKSIAGEEPSFHSEFPPTITGSGVHDSMLEFPIGGWS